LAPDLQKIIDAFYTLSRTRAQNPMSKRPANLQLQDIVTVHDTSGWKAIGMPLDEFLEWMLMLDSEVMAFYASREDR